MAVETYFLDLRESPAWLEVWVRAALSRRREKPQMVSSYWCLRFAMCFLRKSEHIRRLSLLITVDGGNNVVLHCNAGIDLLKCLTHTLHELRSLRRVTTDRQGIVERVATDDGVRLE